MRHAAPPAADVPVVVGRGGELSRIDSFVEGVPAGARALLIRGEPGIGKSTLWRLAVQRCRLADHIVLTARPAEEEMPVPLIALLDILRETDVDGASVRAGDDPFAAGRTASEALRRLSEDRTVVVAIDDLQWLDPATARALRFAFRRSDARPVGLIAAVRSGADRTEPLDVEGTLFGARCDTLDLAALSLEELRQVLAQTVSAISRPMLRRIHEISGGNPLYAIELARVLSAAELSRGSPGRVRLPDSLQRAVAGRLEAAPSELSPLLEVVSGLGRTNVVDLRDAMPDSDVDGLLLVAQGQGLLTVEDDLVVRFPHPLLASAVYARMGPMARRALHARLAGLSEAPDVRARHLALSTDAPDADVATLLEEAAERASRRGASDVAAEFAGHGVRLTPSADGDALRRRAMAEIGYLASAGEVSRALELSDRLIATSPPGAARAEACIRRAELEDDDLATGEAFLLRALDDAGDDELLRGRVLDLLGWMRGQFLGDFPGGIELSRRALEIAERLGDHELEMSAASGLAQLETIAGTSRRDLLDRAIALEEEIGKPRLWGGPRMFLASQLRMSGDLAGSRGMYEEAYAGTVEAGNERWRPYSLYALASTACYEGNLALADDLVHQALQAARDTEDAHVEAWILYPQALVAAWVGRADEARSLTDRILAWAAKRGERPAVARARTLLGLLALSEGDATVAARELATAAQEIEEMGIGNPAVIGALPDAVEALAISGDTAAAEDLLERLTRQADAMGNPLVKAMHDRARGIVLAARGEADAAMVPLDDAAAAFDRLGFRVDAARSVLARGRALLRGGHRTLAADALEDARRRFADMGAVLWEARAAEDLERAAPGRATGALTPTERRVAALVAQGKRNKEIAQALFMSVATVEAHLTRIYRKLEIGSRSELTRLVADGSVAVTGADRA